MVARLRAASQALGHRVDTGADGLGNDMAVIHRRLVDVDRLVAALVASSDPMDPATRMARHDLMNALGAIDNYAELIAVDHAQAATEAEAVRAAVRDIVTRVRATAEAEAEADLNTP
ncbi:hypothetical protein [uncultured Rhodospira sp.]|uniref:hypothetical protein n=1 Tax=uncultured Rhodospira sp. TaxID=1936189 RepID=UPI0026070EE9|nr:hypothetical protein [uncultured Rhodospira sp.]